MSLGHPPDEINPRHISNLMKTDRIVVRYYKGSKRLEKIVFSPKTLEEYLNHFNESLHAPTNPSAEHSKGE